MEQQVPIWEKAALTFEEAACYTNIGINRLRELADEPGCKFVLRIGKRKIIKRKELEQFISRSSSI